MLPQELAKQLSDSFIEGTRTGNGNKFRTLKEDSPEWTHDCCRAAHSTGPRTLDFMLPDDYRFQFIEEAADLLRNEDDWEEIQEWPNADIYTSDLTSWLNSRTDRSAYVDAAKTEGLVSDTADLCEMIQAGQVQEKIEVLHLVREFLAEEAERQTEAKERTE